MIPPQAFCSCSAFLWVLRQLVGHPTPAQPDNGQGRGSHLDFQLACSGDVFYPGSGQLPGHNPENENARNDSKQDAPILLGNAGNSGSDAHFNARSGGCADSAGV